MRNTGNEACIARDLGEHGQCSLHGEVAGVSGLAWVAWLAFRGDWGPEVNWYGVLNSIIGISVSAQ